MKIVSIFKSDPQSRHPDEKMGEAETICNYVFHEFSFLAEGS